MPATDKPMLLTKVDVERLDTYLPPGMTYNDTFDACKATIEAAIELLERWNKTATHDSLYSTWAEQALLVNETRAMLLAYHSTTAASNASKGDA